MTAAPDQLPEDVDGLKAALIEARARLSGAEAMIQHLQLVIAKMKREQGEDADGQRSAGEHDGGGGNRQQWWQCTSGYTNYCYT